ncbi:hypothetical protein ACFLXT_00550, partial [Chloroflexota bacterium]
MRNILKVKSFIGRAVGLFICIILLLSISPSIAYAHTFIETTALTIDGLFTDWGTVGSPASGAYPFQDGSNSAPSDGAGFSNKASDISSIWTAVSSQVGGNTLASPSNLIQNFYYRVDTHYNKAITRQSYYIQLNLGTADAEFADHLLQFWVDNTASPKITIVLYEYDLPYPKLGAFTLGSMTGLVSNVANPYPGFSGVQDTNANGALGLYDGTNYGIEVKVPVDWYSSLYGGAVSANGTGTSLVIGSVFTGTGTLGAIGAVKDTVNDSTGELFAFLTNTISGDTVYVTTAGPNFSQTTKEVSLAVDADGNGVVSPDDTLQYTVVIPNTGNQDSTAPVAFSDTLPTSFTYVTGTLSATSGAASYNATASQVQWLGNISAGSSVT